MMPKAGGFVWSVALLASLLWAGCGSDQPMCAQIGLQAPLGNSPLALTRNAVLLRAGEGFVLAGLDGTTVRWGQLSSNGTLTGESEFARPEEPATTAGGQPLGPLFAVAGKAAPGDQLVVVTGVLQRGTTDHYELHAWVHDRESLASPTMHIVGTQMAVANSGPIRLAASSAPNGKQALVAWGVEGQAVPIHYQMVGPDGVLVGKPGDIANSNYTAHWICLGTTQDAENLAVTFIEAPNDAHPQWPAWRRFDMNDDGSKVDRATMILNLNVTDCRIVSAPTSDGYLLAWQDNANNGGTSFARLIPAPPDSSPDPIDDVVTHPVLASAYYGGYSQMPKLGWIAPVGYEFTIGLAGSRGPEVVRFDDFADPQGRALYLPSLAGNTGPLSAWVGNDAVYVTYLDMPGSPARTDAAVAGENQRYLVTVLIPGERD
jgi:hypothetical protein